MLDKYCRMVVYLKSHFGFPIKISCVKLTQIIIVKGRPLYMLCEFMTKTNTYFYICFANVKEQTILFIRIRQKKQYVYSYVVNVGQNTITFIVIL